MRLDDVRLLKRVMIAEVSGRRPIYTPKFGNREVLQQALGRKNLIVEVAKQRAIDRREWKIVLNG